VHSVNAGLAAQQPVLAIYEPVLAIYEDVHWIDPTTLELLDQVVERVRRLSVLVLITFRPEFNPTWAGQAHVTQLPLNRLGRRQGAPTRRTGQGRQGASGRGLRADRRQDRRGALFVEELTKTMPVNATSSRVRCRRSPFRPPCNDSLMARLDRLAPVKEVAQIGAAIGREFRHDLLAAVSPLPEPDLDVALEQLVGAECDTGFIG
jgi:predicted ATPase